MRRKNLIGLIAIVAIVMVAMGAGCIEEEKASTSIPTPISTPIPESEILKAIYDCTFDKEMEELLDISYDEEDFKETLKEIYGEEMTYEEIYEDVCGVPYGEPIPTPIPTSKKWHSVTSFSGSSDKTTQSFTIKGDEWRVKYEVKSSNPKYALFGVFVYPRGETAIFIADWDCWQVPCIDTEYIYEGNGDYYFEIMTANLDSWNLEVEDYY